jgi:DNA primase catalytic core
LVISPEKNLWHCLGACGTGGTVIDWVMKTESVSFRHAVEILREGRLPASTGPVIALKGGHVRGKLPSPVTFNAEDRELMKQVITYYHETLKKTPEGLSYLEKRGLKNTEMIDHFKIGYSNRTLGLRLPESSRKEGAAIRERLQKIGLYRDTGREHFAGSIVFPIFDEHGHVSEIYGRKTCHKLTPGLAYHMYLPGPHKGVFNLDALKASKDIILCEAVIDALTFWCAGFRNVTASYGVNGFTPDHLAAFKKYGVERVFIAYDRDQAGDNAAKKLAETLIAEGFECFRILFPRNMDANDYALKTQPAQKALDLVYRNAVWLGKGKRATRNTAPGEGIEVSESSKFPETGGPPEPKAATNPHSGGEPERAGVEKLSGENPGPEGVNKPFGEPEKPETPSQPSKNTKEIFPLAAEKSPAEPPKPEPGGGLPPRNAPTKPCEPVTEIRDEEIIITLDERRWRVRGLSKNMSYDQLKVNLLVSRKEAFFVDTFDLYSARNRAAFLKQASEELRLKEDIIRTDLGKVLLKLEELQDKQIKEKLEPKEKPVVLTPEEQKEAVEMLLDPGILNRILRDFETCGIVGEETNKLVGYLSAVSRKLEKPLAIIIQSSSSAGKTSLMDSFLAFIPEEEKAKYSAMTGQSLFYMGETNLKHKVLAVVEEEGAERAAYALKLLQSEGELTIASTGKDPHSGKLITHEYRVEGPVMIFITTTKIEIDEELQNRCIMLTVNESREQTRAIHQLQRRMETLEGLLSLRERDWIYKRHKNAQRLLKPILVANPYAYDLTFLDDTTRTRRDHIKYLTLIRSIALLQQFQRSHKTTVVRGKPEPFIEVVLEDIELANKLANEVLGRTLDELLPQTRKFLNMLFDMVKKKCESLGMDQAEYRFQRREICEFTTWSLTQVRLHLQRLVEMEYVLVHKGFRGQSFVYELLYQGEGRDGSPFVLGLINVEKLREKLKNPGYDSKVAGFYAGVADETEKIAGPKRPQNGPETGVKRGQKNQPPPADDEGSPTDLSENGENSHIGVKRNQDSSYLQDRHNPVATKQGKEKGNGSGEPL